MTKGLKITLWIISFLLLLFILSAFLNYSIKQKIEYQLNNKLGLQYSRVSTSLLRRTIIIDSIRHDSIKGKLSRIEIGSINWLNLVKTKTLELENVSFKLSDIHYPVNAGLQHINIDSVSKVGNKIKLFNVVFTSPYNVETYMEKLKHRKPYVSLHFPQLDLFQVNLENRHINLVQTKSFNCKVSEDLNISRSHNKKKLLAEIIRNFKTEFRIDSLDLHNGNIEYSLKDKGSNEKGFIDFNDVSITGQNITNDSLGISENQSMVIEFESQVENQAPLHIVTNHFLGEENYHFDLYAKLTNLELEHGNEILRSSKGIGVESGVINSVVLNGRFNDQESEGEVNIDYENLKIDLNRKYDGLLNLLSNVAINNNKQGSEVFELNRNKEKSFMIHIWQSLLAALRKLILVI